MQGWKLCAEGLAWRVGKGDRINLWNSRWIPNLLVKDVVTNVTWNLTNISFSLPSEVTNAIQSIHIVNFIDINDQPYWLPYSNGIFNLKSVYKLITPIKEPILNFSWIWNLKIPRKISYFLWLCYHNKLPSRAYLHHIGLNIDEQCPVCRKGEENLTHIFQTCPTANRL